MKAGIYRIINSSNGKCYVGSSIDINRRRLEHFSALLHNRHVNNHLQNAYNKYGKDSFIFEVIENLEITDNIKEDLLEREQFWIDNLRPEYNILLVAGSTLGYHHTEETKQKISNSTKGVKKSVEHKAKLSQAAKHRKSQSHHSIINIDGVVYNSIKEASERTGVKYNTIQKRLKNPNFGNYFYVKYPNKINNETIKIEEHD